MAKLPLKTPLRRMTAALQAYGLQPVDRYSRRSRTVVVGPGAPEALATEAGWHGFELVVSRVLPAEHPVAYVYDPSGGTIPTWWFPE